MSVIKPIFDEQAVKQLELIDAHLASIEKEVDTLSKKKLSFESFTKAKDDIDKTAKATDQLSKATKALAFAQSETGQELVRLRTETAMANAETRKRVKELELEKLAGEGQAETYDQLNAQYKLMQINLKRLGAEQGVTSEEFVKAKKEFDEVRDKIVAIDQASGDGSKTVGLYRQEFGKALQDVGLFGSEIQKVQGFITAFKNTQEQVSEALTKYAEAQNLANGAKEKGITSLAKMRIALISTGIGAIAVAVGVLAVAFFSTQRGADALTRTLEPLKAIFSALLGVLQNVASGLVDAFTNPQEALKSLVDLIQGQLQKRLEAFLGIFKSIVNLDFKQAGKDFLSAFTLSDEIVSGYQKTRDFLKDNLAIGKEIAESKILIQKLENDLLVKTEERKNLESELQEIAKDTSLSFEERRKAVDQIVQLTKEQVEQEQEVIKEKINQLILEQSLNDTKRKGNGSTEELLKLQAQLKKLDGDAQRKENEFMKVKSGFAKEQQKLAEEASKKESDRLERIRELSSTEAENLTFKFEQLKKELGLNKEIATLTQAEQKALENITAEYDAQIAKLNKIVTEYVKAQDILDENARAQVTAFDKLTQGIEDAYIKGELSAQEYYNAIKEAQKQYVDDTLQSTIDMYKSILENEDISADEKLKIEQDLYKAKQELRDKELSEIDAKLKAEVEAEKKRAKEIEHANSEKWRKINEGVKLASEFANEIGNEMASRTQMRLDAELSQFKTAQEEKLTADLEYATANGATQQELELIKQRNAEETAKKEREIKRKQAEADKRKALFDILTTTAVNIVKAIGSAPFPANIPAIALATAQGALTTALVASRPIPEFYKGVENFEGGVARVGERGMELIEEPNRTWLANKDMTTYLPKGTNVKTAKETKKILNDPNTEILKGIYNKTGKPIVNIYANDTSSYKYRTR
jgi:hypothetical protein